MRSPESEAEAHRRYARLRAKGPVHLEPAVQADSPDWFPAGMVRGVLSLPVRYRTA